MFPIKPSSPASLVLLFLLFLLVPNYKVVLVSSTNHNNVHLRRRRYLQKTTTTSSSSSNIFSESLVYDWQQMGTDIDGEYPSDESGSAVSLSADGMTIAIGARFNKSNNTNGFYRSGHARVYRFYHDDSDNNNGDVSVSGQWKQLGNDLNGDNAGDWFGSSISLSADGTTVAIGAPFNGANGFASGHVRVYHFQNDEWMPRGVDLVGNTRRDRFGDAVAISADGLTVAVGAPGYDGTSGVDCGHVRVFRFINERWNALGDDLEGESGRDNAGSAISLSADGNTVSIVSPWNDGNGTNSGHVRVYHLLGGVWTQMGGDIDGKKFGDWSMWSVSLSDDGTTVAIGSPDPRNIRDFNGILSGYVRVYHFVRDGSRSGSGDGGGYWKQVGTDISHGNFYDLFGWSVSLSGDGNMVVVGAGSHAANRFRSVPVRAYRLWEGDWMPIGRGIEGEYDTDESGFSLSLSGDGSVIAIGVPMNDGNGVNSGHVRVFKLLEISNGTSIASTP